MRQRNLIAAGWGMIVLLYAAALWPRISSLDSGPDQAGYVDGARLLAQHHLSVPLRIPAETADPWLPDFVPVGFAVVRHGTRMLPAMVPAYPLGPALDFLPFVGVGGWDTGLRVAELFGALASLAAVWALYRSVGISTAAAVAATGALGVSAVFEFAAAEPLSDVPALLWCTLAMLAACRAQRGRGPAIFAGRRSSDAMARPRGSGMAASWAAIAGLAFAVAVWVRPTNVLLAPALWAILAASPRRHRSAGAATFHGLAAPAAIAPGAVTAVAGILGFAAMGVLQRHLYGSPFSTGYGSVAKDFAAGNLIHTLWFYVSSLAWTLPLGLASVVAWLWAERSATRVFALWAIPFVLLYACYGWSAHDWTFIRYLLPAFPALLGISASSLDRLPRFGRIVAAVGVVVGSAALNLVTHRPDPAKHDAGAAAALAWQRENVPDGAVVLSGQLSGMMFFHTQHPILRWDVLAPRETAMYLPRFSASGRPVYALMEDWEVSDPRFRRLPLTVRLVEKFPGGTGWYGVSER